MSCPLFQRNSLYRYDSKLIIDILEPPSVTAAVNIRDQMDSRRIGQLQLKEYICFSPLDTEEVKTRLITHYGKRESRALPLLAERGSVAGGILRALTLD